MYCRKCLKESEKNEKSETRINMNIDMEEQCYICPECGHVVYWAKEDEN